MGPHSSYTPVTDVEAVRALLEATGGELRLAVTDGEEGEPGGLIRIWADRDAAQVVAPFHQYDLPPELREAVWEASGTWDVCGVIGWLLQRGLVDEARALTT